MNLCRIFYKEDGTVSIMSFPPKARIPGETDQEMIDRIAEKDAPKSGLDGLEYEDVEASELPQGDKEKRRGAKGQGVYIDESVVTTAEKRQALEDKIDTELAKPEAEVDTAKVIKWNRKLQKGNYDDEL
jgi:hypothetical protein